MAAENIQLVAPNGLSIVGIRLEDGSICQFDYSYNGASGLRYFKLLNKGESSVMKQDEDSVLVDSSGRDWPATDIEFHSILKR